MILVDTSVWIDFLSNRSTPATTQLVDFLEREEVIVFTGIILQELCQGCRHEKEVTAIENHFKFFLEIFPERSTYKLAAQIYRDCRRQGFTIRSSIDCLIAACALESGSSVLQQDRDYLHIAKVTLLQLVG
jgi:predicted nucleic acid-binding protein